MITSNENKTTTHHQIHWGNAANMQAIEAESVDLVVTSPPYPMIEMWDEIFAAQETSVKEALKQGDGPASFEAMHQILDKVWAEVYRVLKVGGIACINIGDATRTIDKHFRLYSNHARILQYCILLGFSNLPTILWRKQTNAPNKFMGSGMLPPGAYVTLEHEYILILRKGNKRNFKTAAEKLNRSESAYFWEERNVWFSDIWDLKGVKQKLSSQKSRDRSAAYPFELAYRLVNMFSVKGDTVLDPFLGTATTTLAAIASKRNSIGYEIDPELEDTITEQILDANLPAASIDFLQKRIARHLEFVHQRQLLKGANAFKYESVNYGFRVITRQEVKIRFEELKGVKSIGGGSFEAEYGE
ncbi:MAG: site-specific DNA-methyltransferase [Chitinophagales bacterium]